MYGWRGRIGVILPADNAVLEPDFHRMAPKGVSAHIVRLQKSPRPEMPARAVEVVQALVHTRVNVVAYMCAASSFVLGPAGNAELCTRLSEATGGLTSFTATTAMVDALKVLQAKRVAVLAPHSPEIAEKLASYLRESGFAVTALQALGLELAAINDSSPSDVYRAALALDTTGADAIFIAATNFRAIDVIQTIEADTGLPVVTSNQVAMWKALTLLGISEPQAPFGRLMEGGGSA